MGYRYEILRAQNARTALHDGECFGNGLGTFNADELPPVARARTGDEEAELSMA